MREQKIKKKIVNLKKLFVWFSNSYKSLLNVEIFDI
jgi:hypothetical protein